MEVNKTKTYWIEKIEYPEVHCIPYGNYDDKEDALQGFMDCVESVKEDKTTCVALYEVEDDYDTRIRFYDEGKITNEDEVYDCEQTDICIMCGRLPVQKRRNDSFPQARPPPGAESTIFVARNRAQGSPPGDG